MRIAVPYENGMIFQHFGKTEAFRIYDIGGTTVTASRVIGTNGSGHGALADFLIQRDVDTLICGGIGDSARTALASAGIDIYGGVSGGADDAVMEFLAGKLEDHQEAGCAHHEHGGQDCDCHGSV